MIDINNTCLEGCNPAQIVTLSYAINDISSIYVHDSCDNAYDRSSLQYAYSLDGACYSCFMSYEEALNATVSLNTDLFIRIKVNGDICSVSINGDKTSDYSASLAEGFSFSADPSGSNTYNPYANMDGAIALQQQLSETVSSLFGIPIYYFKLSPNAGSKDITFKEYALMDVEAVKQIKLIIADGQMPSSRPEFSDFGLEFQTEWETEISKATFATAFGNNAQPMEGDLIYIPLMKRMWMVNAAYEEKNESLMWQATTFKVALVKYQEKGSVNLGDTEELVNTFVKNKYDDLFGNDENSSVDSGMQATSAPVYAANTLYAVYESDSTRKYVTCDTINIEPETTYYRGALVSDMKYMFSNIYNETSSVIYQHQYCGEEGTISFIIHPNADIYEGILIELSGIQVNIKQTTSLVTISCHEASVSFIPDNTYLVILRWSSCMNTIDMSAYIYSHNEKIPGYILAPQHYFYEMNAPVDQYVSKFDIEYIVTEKSEMSLHGLSGWITDIKLFDLYNDKLSDMLQMYPNNQHLVINDTARRIVGLPGVLVR